MKPAVIEAIALLLDADSSVSADHRRQVIKSCKQDPGRTRRKLISAKQAAEILECHPKTVHRYVRMGLFSPVRFTARKIRFDLEEVETFASRGVPTGDAKPGCRE